MKVLFKKLKKTNKVALVFFTIAFILYIGLYSFLMINVLKLKSVETLIRTIALAFFGIWFIVYFLVGLIKLVTKKYKLFTVLTIFTYLFIGSFGIGNYLLVFAYDKLDNFTEKEYITYTSLLIGMKDKEFSDKSIIGMISNEDDIEGNILAKKIISKNKLKNEIKSYDDYPLLVSALYEGKVDAIFVSDNYVTIFSGEEDFPDIGEVTKTIYSLSEKRQNEDKKIISNKKLTEPFTILVMGVDSEKNGLNANAAFNGDTLILATFNPKTLTASMFSVPRDTYVPIACRNKAYAKINSSAAYGTSCVIDTMENLTGITIDYYAKINFKGVVDLVEALGGITVDVEKPDYQYNHGFNCQGKVCEQNSNREWQYAVFIEPGKNQKLNGEQALAYSRCRGLYSASDLARNRHQQDVITAIANKAIKIRDFKEFEKVLDAVSNNIATNMSRDQIISSYDIFKNMIEKSLSGEEMITIKKTYLEVSSLPVNLGTRITSALSYYPNSLEEIVQMMKENLELVEPKMIKTFSFDSNEEYSPKIYGKGIKSGSKLELVPSFIGKSVSEAESWGTQYNISVSFNYVGEGTEITNQSVPTGSLIKNVSAITFTVGKIETEVKPTTPDSTPDPVTEPDPDVEPETKPEVETNPEVDEIVEDMLE